MTDPPPDDLEALVAEMRGPFLRTSCERVALIARLDWDCGIAADPGPLLVRLGREAHTLRGGGAAFGFPSLSGAAADVEAAGQAAAAAPHHPPLLDALHRAVERLQAAIDALQ